MVPGGAGWCWVVLGGAGWCRVVLGGAGWCWVVLGGAGWCWEVWVVLGGAGMLAVLLVLLVGNHSGKSTQRHAADETHSDMVGRVTNNDNAHCTTITRHANSLW